MNNRLRDVVAVTASLAILAGAVEAAFVVYRKFVLGQIVFRSFDFPWMAAAGSLVLILPGALALYGVSVIARRPLMPGAMAGLLSGLLLFSLMLQFEKIAWWAWALLGVGVAMQVSRRASRARSPRWIRALTTAAAVAGVVLACVGVGVRIARANTERRASETLPAASPAAPNVLLIVLDTVRSSNLSLYGYDRPTTPGMEQWAREGVVFEHAMVTAPWTLPSHATMFTGRQPGELETSWKTPMSASPRTLAESLRDRGYATGGFVANTFFAAYETGLARGFIHYDDYRVTWPGIARHSPLGRMDIKSTLLEAGSWRKRWTALVNSRIGDRRSPAKLFRPATSVAEGFLDWQASLGGRPFFAFLNLFDAHGPVFGAPADLIAKFRKPKFRLEDLYDASIAGMDRIIDELMATLRARGVLDRTLIVVVSDHGEHFGEHGLSSHANSLYLPLLHVPLVMRFPGVVPPATRVDTLVSLVDLPATILDLVGARDAAIPGSSLADTWLRPGRPIFGDVRAQLEKGINADPSDPHASSRMVSVFDDRLHYIRGKDDREELYEYRADPKELSNLAGDPSRQSDLARLRARAVWR